MRSTLMTAARAALVVTAISFGALTASAQEKFDASKFFAKLQADGASMPAGFDAKKFFDKLAAEGSSNTMPPMVDVKK
ncbi:MAG: hypothetical protein K2Y05_02835 [Hyphomicrobiaceae bacterium]|nr:hypothetical protein [Hyphomicrobiaceae bacterium]